MAIPTSFVMIMYYICLHVGLHVAAQHSGHQTSGGLAVLQHCLSILGYHYKCDKIMQVKLYHYTPFNYWFATSSGI